MNKLGKYIGKIAKSAAEYTAALTLSVAISSCKYNPAKEPRLLPSVDPQTMLWSFPGDSGEYGSRLFRDKRPYGSLDQVILRTHDGEIDTLNSNDEDFKDQKGVYEDKVLPILKDLGFLYD